MVSLSLKCNIWVCFLDIVGVKNICKSQILFEGGHIE